MRMKIADIKLGRRYRRQLARIPELAGSIEAVGLLHPPVVLKDGTLVAGARRIAAAEHLGWIDVPVTVAANLVEAAAIIRAQGDENVQREPWETEAAIAWQEAMLPAAKEAAKERQAEGQRAGGETGGKGRPKAPGDSSPGNSREAKASQDARDVAASPTGYSEKTLRMAKYVHDAAKKHPALFREIAKKMDTRKKKGEGFELAVSAAYKQVQKIEAQEAISAAAQAVVDAPADESCDLRVCPMADLLGSLRDLDAIITDPPYPEEFLPLYGELARMAAKALKPDGILAVMCGQSYLPRILADMSSALPYRWTLAYLTPGGQAVQLWDRSVNTFWKPILVFGGKPRWLGDVVNSDVNDNDKRFHGWGQSESGMAALIERLTIPGQTVCDPFLGAGTTAVACLTRGRRFVGCDIEASCVEMARGRAALAIKDLR